jgi:hypothetical protein
LQDLERLAKVNLEKLNLISTALIIKELDKEALGKEVFSLD